MRCAFLDNICLSIFVHVYLYLLLRSVSDKGLYERLLSDMTRNMIKDIYHYEA